MHLCSKKYFSSLKKVKSFHISNDIARRCPNMKTYSTKEVAGIVDIAESTVRKYSQLLEGNGFQFERNASGYRIFTDKNIEVFIDFQKVCMEGNSINDAAKIVARKYMAHMSEVVTEDDKPAPNKEIGDMLKSLTEKVDILTDMNEQQAQFNQELLNRLDHQQEYIDKRLKERDKVLLRQLDQQLETRKQIAVAEENKKGFFSRLFKK